MVQTRGRAIRMLENTPEYEAGPMYRHVLRPFGVHWGMGVPVALGDGCWLSAHQCKLLSYSNTNNQSLLS